MSLSITDRLLPKACTFQFVEETRVVTKAMKFTAGRLTETLRVLASLVEQVVLRTLYYASLPKEGK